MVAAIYNVFDGLELLPYSVKNIKPLVERVIIVYQEVSNHGEKADVLKQLRNISRMKNVDILLYEPDLSRSPAENERMKRNYGLEFAKNRGFTHFLDIDCDEFYVADDFLKEKQRVLNQNLNGLVCRSQVYFKSPTLTTGIDVTLVPILLKIDGCRHEMNKNMPFAWSDIDGLPVTLKKRIRIDPTRQVNFTSGIEWSNIIMHHYSWVRKDYGLKIRNSSARANIERSTILQDLLSAKEGYYCDFYRAQLTSCPNVFGLPEWQKEQDQSNHATVITSAGNR